MPLRSTTMTTPSVGTMYLYDNTMTIKAGDDGIHASGDLIIDSGTL